MSAKHRRHSCKRKRRNPQRKALTIPEQHQLKIALQTLKMNDVMARVMGGMTKAEAREVIRRLKGKNPKRRPPLRPGERIKVQVVFRKFPEGDVIALFPNEPADRRGHILSYQHIGQHGGADFSLIQKLEHVSKKEYMPLYDELVGLGYDLVVSHRIFKNPRKPPLGSGARFRALVRKLKSRKGKYKVRDPRALAAVIGRRKYGKAEFQKLAARGKWRKRAITAAARRRAANPGTMGLLGWALIGTSAYFLYKQLKKG